jgi:hypothetical protein
MADILHSLRERDAAKRPADDHVEPQLRPKPREREAAERPADDHVEPQLPPKPSTTAAKWKFGLHRASGEVVALPVRPDGHVEPELDHSLKNVTLQGGPKVVFRPLPSGQADDHVGLLSNLLSDFHSAENATLSSGLKVTLPTQPRELDSVERPADIAAKSAPARAPVQPKHPPSAAILRAQAQSTAAILRAQALAAEAAAALEAEAAAAKRPAGEHVLQQFARTEKAKRDSARHGLIGD